MESEQKLTVKDVKHRTEDKEMDLSMMGISKVPVKEMAAVPKATSIDLSCNKISVLPDNFCGALYYVVKLDLSKNNLTNLPSDFSKMQQLQHLDLYENKLRSIPVCFAELGKLKWLDLKDNQFDAGFLKVIGDCLDDKQCRQCALNVVKTMKAFVIRKRQEELKRLELEKEADAARKKEEEKARKLKKQQKLIEKEKRRKEWKQRQEENKLSSADDNDEDVFLENDVEKVPDESDSKKQGSSFCMRFLSVAVLLLAVAVGVYFFCETNKDPAFCHTYSEAVQTLKEEGREFSVALSTVFSDYKSHLMKTADVGAEFVSDHFNQAYSKLRELYLQHIDNA